MNKGIRLSLVCLDAISKRCMAMMDIEEMRRRSRGLYVFAITPFVEEGGRTLVDVEGVKRNIEFWVENRVPVVVAWLRALQKVY